MLNPAHFPFNMARHYWLCLWSENALPLPFQKKLLEIPEILQERGSYFYLPAPRQWGDSWYKLKQVLKSFATPSGLHFAVIPGIEKPSATTLAMAEKSFAAIDGIAQNLWLGDAVLAQGLRVEWQAVYDKSGRLLAKEAFARLQDTAGQPVDGTMIFHAARGLQIEAVLDAAFQHRALQHQTSRGETLFLNQIPAFTTHPEIHLPPLLSRLQQEQCAPAQLILDLTPAGLQFEPLSLRKTLARCHEHGLRCALDDISTARSLQPLLAQVRPDFIKLNMGLVHFCTHPAKHAELQGILAAAGNIPVIAKGVETQAQYQQLLSLGVEYFQGRHLP